MIHREINKVIIESAKAFPIIGVVGPRQSGKTTLVQELFPDYQYVNLEELDTRQFANDDPRGFLKKYGAHVILDEVQRAPQLFSYLQVKSDQDKIPAQYILTGSQHFLMIESITQTLAGRIALFQLYPLSFSELSRANLTFDHPQAHILQGGYPRLYDQPISRETWFNSYIQTYLDRDISLLSHIENLWAFEKFLRLAAGRTGQLLNYSNLGKDVGLSHNTIRSWINLLVTSGIVYLLEPFFANVSKRLIKSPKMYFVDSGLACSLLGINTVEQLETHPLYGALFETWIIAEVVKNKLNQGMSPRAYFWRDQQGNEADLLVEQENQTVIAEIKSSQTISASVFAGLNEIHKHLPTANVYTIYGGDDSQSRTQGTILSWKDLKNI